MMHIQMNCGIASNFPAFSSISKQQLNAGWHASFEPTASWLNQMELFPKDTIRSSDYIFLRGGENMNLFCPISPSLPARQAMHLYFQGARMAHALL